MTPAGDMLWALVRDRSPRPTLPAGLRIVGHRSAAHVAARAALVRDMYWLRQASVLETVFPRLVEHVGMQAFRAWVAACVEQRPTGFWDIEMVGAVFVASLEETAPAPVTAIARLEWALALSFAAPDVTSLPVAAVVHSWVQLHPSTQLVQIDPAHWSVVATAFPSLRAVEGEPDVGGATMVLVTRRNTKVRMRAVHGDECALLLRLAASTTAFATLCVESTDPQRMVALLTNLLRLDVVVLQKGST